MHGWRYIIIIHIRIYGVYIKIKGIFYTHVLVYVGRGDVFFERP